MNHFCSIKDIKSIKALIADAKKLQENSWAFNNLGQHKTLLLLFYNSSLRTHLSTEIAAQRLGLSVITKNMSTAWNIELKEGAVMDQQNAEHIKDAAGVVGTYADLLAVRAFPSLKDKSLDYSEPIINAYHKYAGIPLLNLESGARHPLQALADMISIESLKKKSKPKVVLSWAPHPKVLPQSVANSFAVFSNAMDYDVHVCHPEGYALDAEFVADAKIHHNQEEAFKDADFIYAKNWSSTANYGTNEFSNKDWMISEGKMALTNDGKFMHCLPVRRNVVVTDGVIDSKNSLTQLQAANRILAAQIVLKQILENG